MNGRGVAGGVAKAPEAGKTGAPVGAADKRHRRVMVLGGIQMDRLIAGVFDFAKTSANWRVQVSSIGSPDPAGGVRYHKADGVIVSTPNEGVVDSLLKATPHVVVVNADQTPANAPSVHIDDHRIGRLGAEHLMEYGHRHFAFAGWDAIWTRERLAGFEEALAEAGHRCHVLRTARGGLPSLRSIDGSNSQRVLVPWIKSLPRPCGVMLNHDGIAFSFFEACESIDRQIPDDIAVVGVDNAELQCLSTQPTLSSIDTNLGELGFAAAAILAEQLAGHRVENRCVSIQAKGVVVRQSTDRHRFEDEEVNRALEFIRANADEPIGVEDVLDQVQISRSSLEARFRRHLGHTPGAEIRRVRLELARKLLLESNMSLIEIGVRCGFSSLSYLSQAFKRAYGISPHHYRMQHKRR